MGSAVCQIQGPATSYSCGMASNFVISDYGGDVNDTICPGVRITYTNGDLCPALQTNRSTVLDIGCSVNNTGTVTSVTEGDACDYAAQMLAGAACGYIPGTSVTPSVSYSPIPTNSTDASPSSSGGVDSWVWWTLGAVGIVLLVVVIAGAGFFVYKKKRSTYDSLGDYDD
eukprot:CAMPEP_0117029918 /NCGR_PEP_ID=MMETSP0472-20121206/21619_1 /TAXON_ID=693140 ORGANISM="Tiarina fusus, Strain LIS" /NCGR_SAMPLE_ID=MMETSP0472 /ASSEMBLY_ACC=CAM_ASM_000603 /LENGTH=169 /DNA_ID=CAMNT_0004737809 /DNA_START=236 /DNA_END=745 /DNA_ORIENTATION=+